MMPIEELKQGETILEMQNPEEMKPTELNPEEPILLENSIRYLFFCFLKAYKGYYIIYYIVFNFFSILITPILFANFRISLSLIIIQINYRVETVKQLHFLFVAKVLPQI